MAESALARYGDHLPECRSRLRPAQACSCGYADALAVAPAIFDLIQRGRMEKNDSLLVEAQLALVSEDEAIRRWDKARGFA